MTVRELMRVLVDLDPELPVVVLRSSEARELARRDLTVAPVGEDAWDDGLPGALFVDVLMLRTWG